ncbi:MAG: hypothetical protein JW767_09710 [Thermoleophilia bacterium]|nr:hypothetical protein [Thermoleophilia bacterium]
MTQRCVTVHIDGELAWVVRAPELLPCHTRPATAEALDELVTRYLPDPDDIATGALTYRVAGILAGLLAQRELRGPWRG